MCSAGASLTVEGIVVDDSINGFAHPILLISYNRRRDGCCAIFLRKFSIAAHNINQRRSSKIAGDAGSSTPTSGSNTISI